PPSWLGEATAGGEVRAGIAATGRSECRRGGRAARDPRRAARVSPARGSAALAGSSPPLSAGADRPRARPATHWGHLAADRAVEQEREDRLSSAKPII